MSLFNYTNTYGIFYYIIVSSFMTYIIEKQKVCEMRSRGMSINEISKKLGLNKSTISYWCRDIELSNVQKKRLLLKQKSESIKALLRSAEKKKVMRVYETKELKMSGARMIGEFSKRDLFLAGLGLYWGEGYKETNNELCFTNSDYKIILFIMRWFREIYQVKNSDFIFRLSINSLYKKREKEILEHWLGALGVFGEQFSKTSFIKTKKKKIYQNGKIYQGTLRLKVRKSTRLKRKIMGSIEKLSNFSK